MIYAATIFLSSFLLFLVQPLVARLILPWFGGSAAVWTTCMLFFQVMLLAGYAYAHFLTRKLAASKLERIVHTVLLLAAIALLPIAPGESWKPLGEEEPISRILLLLLATVGLPYFLLAATSPLLQAWFVRSRAGEDPYRLFAVSNLASLLALVGYPFVVEPFLTAHEQVTLWSWLFAAFAVLCAILAWRTPLGATDAEMTHRSPAPTRERYALWLALAAAGSVLLLAVTNHLTQNVASVPLLWLAPLTLYLLTFILTFEGGSWYQPKFLWPLILGALGVMAWLLIDQERRFDLAIQLAVFLPGLFVACFFCHGELYRSRPAPEHLTAFYLTVSAGGALGGLAVAVVAPLVFNGYYELGVGLVGVALLAALRFRLLGLVSSLLSASVLLGVTACAAYDGFRQQEDVMVATRGFYGVLRVKEYGIRGEENHLRRLVHGTIMHGEQYLHESQRRMLTTYYQETSGVGLAIASKQDHPVRVGVIGLGTGTIAAYGRKGDVFRFYEIDPHVLEIARRDFTFLGDSAAKIEVAIGDARLSLEREAAQGFDVLAVDAFSSDAIPVHLITREAFRLYFDMLAARGILALHISNRYLRLEPVVANLAEDGRYAAMVQHGDTGDIRGGVEASWAILGRRPEDFGALASDPRWTEASLDPQPAVGIWSDDFHNLLSVFKW